MSIIKVMDVNLSNKIAAGEVIEKLMNIVKELVENSLDAKSTSIKIELVESGLTSIKVTDNGCGMERDDATNCLFRHATSKLYDEDDLFSIDTLGFRGEALPSIASVSKMNIKTCKDGIGTEVLVQGGKIISVNDCLIDSGTIITVSDIFYNTPARLKYLKSLYSELSNIIDYVNKMALAYSNVRFELINNDKVILLTDGSCNILKVINSIYGLSVTKKMLKIESSNDDYKINGYISYPEINKSTRNAITVIVNGRSVKNSDVVRTILDSYHTYLPKDKTPIVILYIECDPSIIDVNIHPTKLDIKFSKKEELMELIFTTIAESLNKLILIPEAKYENRPISNINEVTTVDNKVSFTNNDYILPKFENVDFEFSYEVSEDEKKYDSYENDIEVNNIGRPKFKMINPVALIHGTYIVGENEDGMYLMDQHAVNERINYEYYKKKMGEKTNDVIDMLVPMKIELSNNDYIIFKENFIHFNELGFVFETFGNNTIIIRSHPTWIKKGYEEETIRKIVELIVEKENFEKEKFYDRASMTLACKMSIKANEHVSLEELKVLIEKLRETDNPFTCPHGRPTIISYSTYELEKLFKRVMD